KFIGCYRAGPAMTMKPVTPKSFQFGPYTLDVARGHLRTAEHDVELRPKSFEVLCHLVENANRLVTKEELIKTFWPNVIVTDESLVQCISEVRLAIGDREQTIIKTVPRRGYRFAAAVSWFVTKTADPPSTAEVQGAPDDSEAARPSRPPLFDRPSVAVLPFANLSGDPQ